MSGQAAWKATDIGAVSGSGESFERGKGPVSAVRASGVAQENVVIGIPGAESRVWLSCGFRPLDTQRGAPYPIVISFTDISQRLAPRPKADQQQE